MNEQNNQFECEKFQKDYEKFKKSYELEEKLIIDLKKLTNLYKKNHMYSLILAIAFSILHIFIIKQMIYTGKLMYKIIFIVFSLNIINMIKILIREKKIINSRECILNELNKQHMIAYEKIIKPNEERNSKNNI